MGIYEVLLKQNFKCAAKPVIFTTNLLVYNCTY